MAINRRDFLGTAAAVGVAAASSGAGPAGKVPVRPFGKTGLTVSALGFGSGSRFLMYREEDEALAALSRAIDLGITYIDTAHAYGDGKSEERIGRLMTDRRKEVTLATKITARKADDARRQIELSLKRLQTDRLDVLHIHELKGPDDLAAIEAPGGVLEALHEARDRKVARAIGITGHVDPAALRTALERHDFDATQMPLNAAMARMADGMKATPMPRGGFEELALPVAVRKGMGVIAMKVFGQGQIVGTASTDELLTYALSLPVSLASCGMPKPEFIDRNAALAARFQPMTEADRRRLTESIAAARKAALVDFFRDHRDA